MSKHEEGYIGIKRFRSIISEMEMGSIGCELASSDRCNCLAVRSKDMGRFNGTEHC